MCSLQVSLTHQNVFTVSLAPTVINQERLAASHALLILTLIKELRHANHVNQIHTQVCVCVVGTFS